MAVCFECGKDAKHRHHIIPRVQGGTRTIPLCERCHGKVHAHDMSISALIKIGQARARAAGKNWGRKRVYDYAKLIELRDSGLTFNQITQVPGMPKSRHIAGDIYRRTKKLNKS